MKKFNFLATILAASTLALSGCLPRSPSDGSTSGTEPTNPSGQSTTGGGTTTGTSGTSTPTGTSSSSTPTPPAPTDWTAAQKKVMQDNLEGVVLPFTTGTWNWYWDAEYECVSGEGKGNTVSGVKGVYDKATGWTFVTYDEEYEYYEYAYQLTDGNVIAQIYEMSTSIPVEVDAWYEPNQQPTTDTKWNEEVSEAMTNVLGELIPFYPLGENYIVAQINELTLIVYDMFTTDYTADYAALLEKTGSGYTKVVEEGVTSYVKAKDNGEQIVIMMQFDADQYGNMIQAELVPNIHDAATWADILPLATYETSLGFKVPSFESSAYTYYEHDGALVIQGAATSDLSDSYETSLKALGLIGGDGEFVNWEETAHITYAPVYDPNDESEDPAVIGFEISVTVTTPTSTFYKEWPAEAITTYLTGFSLTAEIPSLTNDTNHDIKVYELSYEELYAERVEYYQYVSALIEAFGGEPLTDEEIAEYAAADAAANAGLYISMYPASAAALIETYNSKFDTSAWTYEKVEQKDEDTQEITATYHYWTNNENGLTICVWEEDGLFYVQICEPGETPVPPAPGEEVSVTFADLKLADASAVAEIVIDETTNTKVVFDKGTNSSNGPKYYDNGASVRAYGGNTFTVSSDSTITEIDLTFGTGDKTNTISVDSGTYEAGVWKGSANSVKFTIDGTSGHRRIASLTVKF